MNNRLVTAPDGFKSSLYLLFPALCQHLDANILRYHLPVHKLAQKIIFDLARRRKSYFDLTKAQLNQMLEHLNFFMHYHRINQRLVSIPKIHAAPYRRFPYLFSRPFPFRIIHYRISFIPFIIHHASFLHSTQYAAMH